MRCYCPPILQVRTLWLVYMIFKYFRFIPFTWNYAYLIVAICSRTIAHCMEIWSCTARSHRCDTTRRCGSEQARTRYVQREPLVLATSTVATVCQWLTRDRSDCVHGSSAARERKLAGGRRHGQEARLGARVGLDTCWQTSNDRLHGMCTGIFSEWRDG